MVTTRFRVDGTQLSNREKAQLLSDGYRATRNETCHTIQKQKENATEGDIKGSRKRILGYGK